MSTALFPHSRTVLIFSAILKPLYQTLEARSRAMALGATR
jgi:hypothetical protein